MRGRPPPPPVCVRELQNFMRSVTKWLDADKGAAKQHLETVAGALNPTDTMPAVGTIYGGVQFCASVYPVFKTLALRVGQMQLLRRELGRMLNFSAKRALGVWRGSAMRGA